MSLNWTCVGGHEYLPNFLVVRQPDSSIVNFIIEVSGERRPEKQAKVNSALTLWLPAINTISRFGRWEFVEVQEPWNSIISFSDAI